MLAAFSAATVYANTLAVHKSQLTFRRAVRRMEPPAKVDPVFRQVVDPGAQQEHPVLAARRRCRHPVPLLRPPPRLGPPPLAALGVKHRVKSTTKRTKTNTIQHNTKRTQHKRNKAKPYDDGFPPPSGLLRCQHTHTHAKIKSRYFAGFCGLKHVLCMSNLLGVFVLGHYGALYTTQNDENVVIFLNAQFNHRAHASGTLVV